MSFQALRIRKWYRLFRMHVLWAIKLSETRGTEGHMRATRTACMCYFIFSRRNYEVIRYSDIRRGERGAWNGYTGCSPKQRDILVYQSLYNATYGVNALSIRHKYTSIQRTIQRTGSCEISLTFWTESYFYKKIYYTATLNQLKYLANI